MVLKCCIKTDFDALERPVSRRVFGSLPHLFVLFNIAPRLPLSCEVHYHIKRQAIEDIKMPLCSFLASTERLHSGAPRFLKAKPFGFG
jgi:hypothetical protein